MNGGPITVGELRTQLADLPDDAWVVTPAGLARRIVAERGAAEPFVLLSAAANGEAPPEPEIARSALGELASENGLVRLVVLDADAFEGRMFKRKAIKAVGTPAARRLCWLVGELEGVRVYVDGDRVTLTKRDLYP